MEKPEFMEKLRAGYEGDCPCCGRYSKVYHRTLHTTVAVQLIVMYRIITSPGRHTSEYIDANEIQKRFKRVVGDLSKAKYWGLIVAKDHTPDDKRSSGFWRMTELGIEFVKGGVKIKKYAHIYDDKVLDATGALVSIEDCLQNKYSYADLMGS
jgi:hypothetical protein